MLQCEARSRPPLPNRAAAARLMGKSSAMPAEACRFMGSCDRSMPCSPVERWRFMLPQASPSLPSLWACCSAAAAASAITNRLVCLRPRPAPDESMARFACRLRCTPALAQLLQSEACRSGLRCTIDTNQLSDWGLWQKGWRCRSCNPSRCMYQHRGQWVV